MVVAALAKAASCSRPAERLLGGAPGDEPAVEVGHAVRELPHRGEVVGHEDRGEVVPGGDPGEEIEELGPSPRVDSRGRLVEEEQLRLDDEGAGQEDALGLAAGQARAAACRGASSPPTRARTARDALPVPRPDAKRPRASGWPGSPRRRWPGSPGRTPCAGAGSRCVQASFSGEPPSTSIEPESGRARPSTTLRKVVFPPPLGPQRQTNSPREHLERHAVQDALAAEGEGHVARPQTEATRQGVIARPCPARR